MRRKISGHLVDMKAEEGSKESSVSTQDEGPGDVVGDSSSAATTTSEPSIATDVTREGTRDSEALKRQSPSLEAERLRMTNDLDKLVAIEKEQKARLKPTFEERSFQQMAEDLGASRPQSPPPRQPCDPEARKRKRVVEVIQIDDSESDGSDVQLLLIGKKRPQ